jgi:tRNA U34 2-thiouridine synthase MnmA/TrmU
MNPCIDCRIFMFEIAKRVMGEMKADFVVTGEVLGQRPMSQRRDAMVKIDQESGMAGLVLRPLSAKHLPPTLPEREGWVNREQLLDVIGRSRQTQLQLAEDLELKEFGAPAGGCLLTDAEFSVKLRDFFAHTPDPSMAEARLLRYGRHFRVDDRVKVVLGRHEEENKILLELVDQMMTVVEPVGFPGPVAVVTGPSDNDLLEMVGAMILRYSKKAGDGVHRFSYRRGSDDGKFSIKKPFTGSIPEPIHLGNNLLRIQG